MTDAVSEAAAKEPVVRPDGQRACEVCGAPAHFGFGVSIRQGQEGRWSCWEHREAVEAQTPWGGGRNPVADQRRGA
jgi:hypothetical protein